MVTDDGDFFGTTEEQQFGDWLDWGQRVLAVISLASQRVSLALAAGGFAIAGAYMIDRAPMLGEASLAAAGVFGIWLLVASARSVDASAKG